MAPKPFPRRSQTESWFDSKKLARLLGLYLRERACQASLILVAGTGTSPPILGRVTGSLKVGKSDLGLGFKVLFICF